MAELPKLAPLRMPEGYYDLRTEGIVVDGLYWPATACATCGKRFAPYKAAVPSDQVDEYCWGHAEGASDG